MSGPRGVAAKRPAEQAAATPAADDQQRRTRMGLPQSVVFFIWGLMLTIVGLVDTVISFSLGDRLSSALLAAAGVVIISGVIATWKPSSKISSKRCALIVSATAFISLVAGIWISVGISTDFTPQPRLLATAIVVWAITFFSLVAVILNARLRWKYMRSHGGQPEGGQDPSGQDPSGENPSGKNPSGQGKGLLTRHGVAVTAGATILAAIIALPQFWYSSQYLPSTATPVLSIKSKLSSPRPHRFDLAATTAQVEIKNTGKAPVTVLTSMYEITGTSIMRPQQATAYPDPGRVKHATEGNPGPSARYGTFLVYGSAQLIQFGQFVTNQAWLEPDESTTATVVAYFPRDKFDLLRLTTDIAFIRQDRVVVGDPENRLVKNCKGFNVYRTTWPVKQNTLFDWLTESDREVVVALKVGPVTERPVAMKEAKNTNSVIDGRWRPEYPEMHAEIQHKGRSCGHAIKSELGTGGGLEDRSMFSVAGSVSEIGIRR